MKNRRFAPVVVFFGLLLSAQATVKISGDPTDYVKITNAIAQATSGATILLSTGTYYEVVLITNTTLSLSGGYNHDCSAKLPGGKSTVSGYSITGGRGSVFDIEAGNVTLRDLRITDGTPPLMSMSMYGGGLDIQSTSTVVLLSCDIYENRAKGYGGGIYARQSALTLQDTRVFSNSVSSGNVFPVIAGMGGGIAALQSSLLLIGASPVVSNRASGCGGGIYAEDSTTTVSHASIYIADNIASNGGGIYVDNGYLSVNSGTDIGGNIADSLGGGIALVNGAHAIIQGTGTIIGENGGETGRNWATNGCGGGIAVIDSSIILSNYMVASCNSADSMGGACYLNNSRLIASECFIGIGTTNYAVYGGGISSINSTVDIRHFTAVLNGHAFVGGGIYASNSVVSFSTNCNLGWTDPALANESWFGGGLHGEDCQIALGGSVLHNGAIMGGGLYLIDCRLDSTGGVFRGNSSAMTSSGYGGGIVMYGSSEGNLVNVQIISNRASVGGGICTFSTGDLYLTGSIISSNVAIDSGGGLYCNTSAWIEIRNSTFNLNQAATNGGGVCLKKGGTLIAYDTCFWRNRAGRNGGAISLDESELYSLANNSNVNVTYNEAYEGGGISADHNSVVTVGGTHHYFITANDATNNGGGLSFNQASLGTLLGQARLGGNQANMGGGMFVGAGCQVSTLSDGAEPPSIYNNTAQDFGGGLCVSGASAYVDLLDTGIGCGYLALGNQSKAIESTHGGGGIAVLDGANLSVSNCWINNNRSDSRGGGILVNNATMQMGSQKAVMMTSVQPPNLMENNWATNASFGLGGAIATVDAIVQIRDVLIQSNAAGYGGGIHFSTGSTGEVVNAVIAKNIGLVSGDGIRLLNSSLATLLHTTIVSNDNGVGVYVTTAQAILTNCIVRGHVLSVSAGQQVSSSDIEDGYAGVGNIDLEPHFFDPAGSDYRLKFASPCITSGVTLASVTDDALGMARPQGPRSGMGAFEYNANTYDSDLDSMSDAWETNYTLNPLSAADAALDTDSDSYLNREEYVSDTDPTLDTRYLKILNLSNAGTQTVVSFISSSACAYNLEQRELPDDSGSWTQKIAFIAGTGSRISLTNAEPAGVSSIFRIKAWRP